jgi:hypothetical protein
MLRFYGESAAAYGTLWLSLVATAVVTQSQINTGYLGLFGFPAVALAYAIVRSLMVAGRLHEAEIIEARQRRPNAAAPARSGT